MYHVRMAVAVRATVATLVTGLSWSAAIAGPPQSDLASDATGDVVRIYADGSSVTGYGRSDIRSLSLARTTSPGGSGSSQTAATVSIHLTKIDRRLQDREVRLIVRWITDTGHRARTTTFFGGKLGGRTYVEGLPPDDCVPYVRSIRGETPWASRWRMTASAGRARRRSGRGRGCATGSASTASPAT
jgi:hypothetical protein